MSSRKRNNQPNYLPNEKRIKYTDLATPQKIADYIMMRAQTSPEPKFVYVYHANSPYYEVDSYKGLGFYGNAWKAILLFRDYNLRIDGEDRFDIYFEIFEDQEFGTEEMAANIYRDLIVDENDEWSLKPMTIYD